MNYTQGFERVCSMLTKLTPRICVTGQLAVAGEKYVVVVNHNATPLPPKPTSAPQGAPSAPAAETASEADKPAIGGEHVGLKMYDRTVYAEAASPYLLADLSTDIPSRVFMSSHETYISAISDEGKKLTIWKIEDVVKNENKFLPEPLIVRAFSTPIDAFSFSKSGCLYALTTGNRLYVFGYADDAVASDDDVPSKVDSLSFADGSHVLISAEGTTRLLGIKTDK